MKRGIARRAVRRALADVGRRLAGREEALARLGPGLGEGVCPVCGWRGHD